MQELVLANVLTLINAHSGQSRQPFGQEVQDFFLLLNDMGGACLSRWLRANLVYYPGGACTMLFRFSVRAFLNPCMHAETTLRTWRMKRLGADFTVEGMDVAAMAERFKMAAKCWDNEGDPRLCMVAEDATRILSLLTWDAIGDLVVGFSTASADTDEVELVRFDSVSSVAEALARFTVASFAYAWTASSVSGSALSIPIAHMGMGGPGCMTANTVIRRWLMIHQAAQGSGVVLAGHASDGDSRLLQAMLHITCRKVHMCVMYVLLLLLQL